MLKLIIRVLFTAIMVVVLANILPGIGVDSYTTAFIVAIVLGLLRIFVKPLLIFFTLPLTIVTLGLFLFVINALIILLAGKLVDGFHVSGFWYALLFSLLLSFSQSVLYSFLKDEKQ
ncbi:MAG: phage holin family protein [Aureibaculum sp.]|jgi:putative membrane protein